MARKVHTEKDAREIGRKAGDKAMRKAKRLVWNMEDAAVAIAAYREAAGHPEADLAACRAALNVLAGLTAN